MLWTIVTNPKSNLFLLKTENVQVILIVADNDSGSDKEFVLMKRMLTVAWMKSEDGSSEG